MDRLRTTEYRGKPPNAASVSLVACPQQRLRFASHEIKRRIIHLLSRSATLPSAIFLQESSMSNHVYKRIELTGSSTKTIEDAVSTAIAKASKSVRNIDWFEVVETRGHVENGKVAHWQVTIKVGFTLEDCSHAIGFSSPSRLRPRDCRRGW